MSLLLTLIPFLLSAEAPVRVDRLVRDSQVIKVVRQSRPGVVKILASKPTSKSPVIGSGILVDDRGYILTCRHVIRNWNTLKVVLSDETTHEAEVVVEVPAQDLAVLRIHAQKKLFPLKITAGSPEVGQSVVVIGHPFGYTNTVSTGIISGEGREISLNSGEDLQGLLQTDAAINPGNSGGPLLNLQGEVIGLAVGLRQESQNVGFALPPDALRKVLAKAVPAKP